MLPATLAELMGEVDNLLTKDPAKPAAFGGYGIDDNNEYAKDGKHYHTREEIVEMVFRCQDLLLQIKDAYAREFPQTGQTVIAPSPH